MVSTYVCCLLTVQHRLIQTRVVVADSDQALSSCSVTNHLQQRLPVKYLTSAEVLWETYRKTK